MQPITITTADSTLAFGVDAAGLLRQLAFGPTNGAPPPDLPLALFPLAYPTFTEDPLGLPALRVTNSAGMLSTRVTFDTHQVVTEPLGDLHRIRLVDQSQPLAVTVCVRSWDELGILDQWVEVTNLQDAPVTLHEVAASAPALSGDDPRLDHFCGGWAQEFTPVHDHLTPGTKVLEARGTTRPNHESAPYLRFSPDGPANESDGVTLAAALAWGGNTRIAFERRTTGQVRAWLGHLPTGADYPLEPEETFTTPTVSWAWSDAGTRPLTHRLHRFVRDHVVRDGRRPRAIVANNWEATGFAFDQQRLERFCTDAADVGAELFLLDDGWFGEELPGTPTTRASATGPSTAASFRVGWKRSAARHRTKGSGSECGSSRRWSTPAPRSTARTPTGSSPRRAVSGAKSANNSNSTCADPMCRRSSPESLTACSSRART